VPGCENSSSRNPCEESSSVLQRRTAVKGELLHPLTICSLLHIERGLSVKRSFASPYMIILKSSLATSFAGMTVRSKGSIGRSAATANRRGVRGLTGNALMRSTKE
jgi:hypothetical protein